MKLSHYDRTMATIRLPEYQQEYAEYARLLDIDKKKAERLGNRMAKKWGQYPPLGYEWLLPIRPVPPYVKIENFSFNHYHNKPVEIIDIKNADRLPEIYPPIKLKEELPKTIPQEEVFKRLFDKTLKTTTEKAFNLKETMSHVRNYRPTYSYEGGKFLFLIIDLEQNEKIIEELKSIIKHYKKNMPTNKSRQRDTLINPWKVYDMHYIYGMNFQQITKQLSGINKTGKDGTPSYNKKLMAWYKAIERAYKKADRIIKQVRKESEQPA